MTLEGIGRNVEVTALSAPMSSTRLLRRRSSTYLSSEVGEEPKLKGWVHPPNNDKRETDGAAT